MWSMLARTLAVFVPWGVLLAVALLVGLPQGPAELVAAIGAGLTLLARGVLGKAPAPAQEASTSPVRPRRRASV